MEAKYPKLVAGAFIFNNKGELFLRTTPSQGNRYTCVNGRVEWGETLEETLRKNVEEKTNLRIKSFELIGLTDGLDITSPDSPEPIHMVFADYKVAVEDAPRFKSNNSERKHAWLLPAKWLEMDQQSFGPYIREIIERL